MQNNTEKAWLSNLNRATENILMPLTMIAFLLYSTIINNWTHGFMETSQNIFILAIFAVTGLNIIFNKGWARENISVWIVIYAVVRLVSVVATGFEYAAIRSVMLEMFFLIGISDLTVGNVKKLKIYFAVFIFIITAFDIFSIYVGIRAPGNASFTYHVAEKTSFFFHPYAGMYLNRNGAAIMSGLAIVAMLCFLKDIKNKYAKAGIYALVLFHLAYMLLQGCRSAEIALLAAGLAFLFKKTFKNVSGKTVIMLALAGCLAINGAAYVFMELNYNTNPKDLNTAEQKVNSLSTGRYAIWKGCIIEQKEHFLFGAGALSSEQDGRKELLTKENGYSEDFYSRTKFGPHSGYIASVSVTGWLGTIAFLLVLINKIRKSEMLNREKWYIFVVFLLAVNLFEALFIINRFILGYFVFMIMEMKPEDEENDLPEC